jgi:hypothetical protein
MISLLPDPSAARGAPAALGELPGMDFLTDVLDRVRLNGTLLFQYEFGCPWSLALPQLTQNHPSFSSKPGLERVQNV